MTDPSDDVASRGRAIFQRLRGGGSGDDEPRPDDGSVEPSATDTTADGSPPPDTGPADPPEEVSATAATPVASPAITEAADRAASLSDDPAASARGSSGAGPTDDGTPAPTTTERGALPGAVDLPSAAELEPIAPAPDEPGPARDGDGTAPDERAEDHFARPLPRVMAVANQKGGVGKTTTAVNLGACLADIGYRVLVVDLDPQGNASTGLGINIRDLQGSMYDVILHDLPIEDCVEATSVRNLFCAPSSLDLAGAEIELVPAFSREQRLKRALEEVRNDYDFVLIDCPPSLGLLTVNGLAAATEVVVPIQCEYYALEGLGQLLRNVNLVQKNLNPRLEVSAIVLVMYDARTKLADQVVSEVRAHFGAKVCKNVVPRTVRLSEAPSFGQPIIAFDSSSRGAIAYRELAKEVSGGAPQRAW
ncbi:MAG TPA: AAA family ATPase [Acidimicrobiales bacterium]|nr:AAA family ATPase [Acidimicrobiales bacterium]